MVFRDYQQPPVNGTCTEVDNPSIFWRPADKEEAETAKKLCYTCPVFQQCAQWAEDQKAESNRDRPEGVPTRVPLAGVIAGVWYQPTDTEGRPIDLKRLQAKANLATKQKEEQ